LTDYGDQLREVEVEIAARPARRFVLTLSDELTQAMRKAIRSDSMQTPVNLWVQERLQKYEAAN
jgi:queuine/archaeosine tRNA-ribosyltransferase